VSALVGADIAAIPISLLLVIIPDLPTNIVLNSHRAANDIRAIGRME